MVKYYLSALALIITSCLLHSVLKLASDILFCIVVLLSKAPRPITSVSPLLATIICHVSVTSPLQKCGNRSLFHQFVWWGLVMNWCAVWGKRSSERLNKVLESWPCQGRFSLWRHCSSIQVWGIVCHGGMRRYIITQKHDECTSFYMRGMPCPCLIAPHRIRTNLYLFLPEPKPLHY